MASLKEKYGPWALVTGGTSGIGQSLVDLLAAQGLNIVLVARREGLLKTKSEQLIKDHGIEVRCIQADLSQPGEVQKVTSGAADLEVGLVIPCAGIEHHGVFTEIDLASHSAMLQLNVIATSELTHHFAGGMVKRGRGGIMLVSSMIGHMPNPYFSNYSASKAFVANFGAGLHWEMKQRGVDVTVLSPGYTTTPMTAGFEADGIDPSKMPMSPMTPELTAKLGLEGLGKTALVIPGKKNKFMVFMATKFASNNMAISMGGKMMEKILPSVRP